MQNMHSFIYECVYSTATANVINYKVPLFLYIYALVIAKKTTLQIRIISNSYQESGTYYQTYKYFTLPIGVLFLMEIWHMSLRYMLDFIAISS